jgi:AcrR family transcriptional regulator
MARAVKSTRPYDSSRRREQAAATRLQIVEAAERLFADRGYAATSISAIAREAGVAVKTVYLAFETKSGLLRALWNLRLRGERPALPVAEQEWYRAVLDEADPERQLRLNAANSCTVKLRIGTLLEVIRGAAPIDHDVDVLWQRIQAEFHANQKVVVESIDRKAALAPGLDVDRATDILWMLVHPAVWQLLVGERGWTPEQYEEWLADTAVAQLLAAA